MAERADAVNAYQTGDGSVTAAFRIDGRWHEIRIKPEDADQLSGMFYMLTKDGYLPSREDTNG